MVWIHNYAYLTISTRVKARVKWYTDTMQDAKEEVRSRLAIEDVIGEYIELKRSGRNFKGLSPFSGEKTASFFVSPEKDIWHDFSSNKGGDVFSFVMDAEGLEFRGALELLARKANVDLSLYQNDKHQAIAKKKKRHLEAHKLATNFYQHALLKNSHALEYVFKNRKIDKKTVQEFQIGYAPRGKALLVNFLSSKGFTKTELKEAGLTNRFGGDLFSGRMMVPLMDQEGRVIGFTGRIIDDEPNAPKYLNTPQTLLYDKSWHVFGLSQAKSSIRKHNYAVIVEGNMDTISSHQAGVDQVVATAGTAMTIHHLKKISRLCAHARLAFDADKAGVTATERAVAIAQDADLELSIISLSGDAKDPDDLIQADVALWRASIDSAEPVLDWLIRQYKERYDMKTAIGKRKFTSDGLEVIRRLQDPVEREHYLNLMSLEAEVSVSSLIEKMNTHDKPESVNKKVVQTTDGTDTNKREMYQNNVAAIGFINVGSRQLLNEFNNDIYTSDTARDIIDFLRSAGPEAIITVPSKLKKYDDFVKILLLQADAKYANWNDDDSHQEMKRLLRLLKREHLKEIKQTLDSQLRDAESRDDNEQIAKTIKEIQLINKELNS